MHAATWLTTRDLLLSIALVFAVLGGSLIATSVSAQGPTDPGNGSIYVPPPAPALPPAGGSFVDPTFGTTITRITDPTTLPGGASVNSAAQDSMFNADGTMFYLHHRNIGTFLYGLDRVTGRATVLGQLPIAPPLAYDGAAWDPTNPMVLYAIVMGTQQRQLYQITLPLPGTLTLLHDFSNEIPPGGYPYSRVQVSPDGRYFGETASTVPLGGQDQYDYVVVWDRQTGTAHTLNTRTRMGVTLHSIVMDESGAYLIMEASDYATSYVWSWVTDTVTPALGVGAPYFFGGHKVPAEGQIVNPGSDAGQWVTRHLDAVGSFTELVMYPRKNGKGNWFEDSHSSRLLFGQSFTQSRYPGAFVWGTFVPYSGAIYRMVGFLAISADFDIPDVVRYQGQALQKRIGIPTAPNQWFYDASADTLYVWLPNSANPDSDRQRLSIFDWRPLMEEVIQVFRTTSGTWTWRRLAHNHMHFTGVWSSSPRGNVDPTGRFILFQSNWDATLRNADGSVRQDIFLLQAPALPGTAPPPPPPTDSSPPSVSFTSPTAGAAVLGTVPIVAALSDNVGVTKVEYRLDGGLVAVYSPPVATFSWDTTSVTNGNHTWVAKAYDAAGNTAAASVSVSVTNQPAQGATIAISSPTSGSRVTGMTRIAVSASSGVTLASMKVYLDGTLLGTVACSNTTCSGSVAWNASQTTKGSHILTAVATDVTGRSQTSSPVTVSR